MFMFPEQPPIDYYACKISPTFLSDPVLLNWRTVPTHKYIARQLKPIKRKSADPIAPAAQLDPRVLEDELEAQQDGYVDRCAKVAPTVQEILRLMPTSKVSIKAGKTRTSIFPRSLQYELDGNRNTQIKECESDNASACIRRCSNDRESGVGSHREECGLPALSLSSFSRLSEAKPTADFSLKCVEEKLEGGVTEKSEPTCKGNKQAGSEATSGIVCTDENLMQQDSTINVHRSTRDVCIARRDSKAAPETATDKTERWQPLQIGWEAITLVRTTPEREKDLRRLTKPFLHDLHMWYSVNRPTKLLLPVKVQGKTPKLEYRVSHF